MKRLYIPMSEEVCERLAKIAQAERRHPSEQAALLLEKAVRRAAPPRPIRIDLLHRSPEVVA